MRNGQITADNIEVNGGNATGVMSPILIDGEFYFRRNHKYVIEVKDPEALIKNHEVK